jgi:glycosyltransferase involved in cell wall biosynthesis
LACIGIDATYTADRHPSGIGLSSLHLLKAISELETPHRFLFCYRWSRWKERARFFRAKSPRSQIRTRLFQPPLTFWLPYEADLFHSLAQRPAPFRFRHEAVTVHDVFPLTGAAYSSRSFQKRFSELLLNAVRRSAAVITQSEYTARQVTAHTDVDPRKVRVVHFGVAFPSRMLTAEERCREREPLVGRGGQLVLAVGAIQNRKNTANIVRALACLPRGYKLVLAGAEGYGAETVDQVIEREQLGHRVKKLGYVPDDRLAALYQSADVLAFPSLEEGAGLPVLEAMASRLPVVTAATSCLPEMAGDAALYADPHEPREIAEKIRMAVEDAGMRDALVQKGLERARRFTWRETARQTLEVYEDVLSGRAWP